MLRFAISSWLRTFEIIEIQILLHGGIRHFYPMRNVFNTVLEISLKIEMSYKKPRLLQQPVPGTSTLESTVRTTLLHGSIFKRQKPW